MANFHSQETKGREEKVMTPQENKRQIRVFGYSTGELTKFLQQVNGIKKRGGGTK